MRQRQERGQLHTWNKWIYRQWTSVIWALWLAVQTSLNSAGQVWRNQTDNSGEKAFITAVFAQNKKLRNAHKLQTGQIHTTCIVLVFLHLKILTGSIFSLWKKLSFCMYCKQSGVLDVHLLYTKYSGYYCDFLLLCWA